MIVLGIETSCDETSLALVEDGQKILSLQTYSQISEHEAFRGVVPEIASRAHLEKINYLYEAVLNETGLTAEKFDAVAVTNRPGLVGSLLIGVQFAHSLALVHGLPLVPVDHVEAHFYALALEGHRIEYPCLGLLLSGGNSAIFEIRGPEDLALRADTDDDALGEAFDKSASILNLGYPGGPAMERLANDFASAQSQSFSTGPGQSAGSVLPPLLRELPRPRFSFSGIKTAVLRAHQSGLAPAAIALSFHERTIELVLRNLDMVVAETGLKTVLAGGGVLANGRLRQALNDFGQLRGLQVLYPGARALCTDNAAMIAALGTVLYQQGLARADFSVSSHR